MISTYEMTFFEPTEFVPTISTFLN